MLLLWGVGGPTAQLGCVIKDTSKDKNEQKEKNIKEDKETRKNGFNLYLKITRHDNRPV